MILVFALAGSFTATIAGVTALMMGQSWWIGLASYMGAGMLTVFVLAAFTAFTLKTTARKPDHSTLRSGLTLAER
jgi:heme/copper-type cytochrome/quinol oxidase subunit 2